MSNVGHILLVEDDSNDVVLMQRAFHKTNISNPLQVVHDGEAAIAYLGARGPYADRRMFSLPMLLLLDLKLPRTSGLEVLAWLRAQESLKRLPAIVLTSSREQRDIDVAYDLGANAYLVKPVQFEALLDVIKRLHLFWIELAEKPQIIPA